MNDALVCTLQLLSRYRDPMQVTFQSEVRHAVHRDRNPELAVSLVDFPFVEITRNH
jgi:hypothetical protein